MKNNISPLKSIYKVLVNSKWTHTTLYYCLLGMLTIGLIMPISLGYGTNDAMQDPIACFTVFPKEPFTNQVIFFDARCSYNPNVCNSMDSNQTLNQIYGSMDTNKTYPLGKLIGYDGKNTNTHYLDGNMSLPPSTFGKADSSDATLVFQENQILSYLWDFGDGNISTDSKPTHVYTIADKYTITLTIETSAGLIGSTNQTINVSEPPVNKPEAFIDNIEPNPAQVYEEVSFSGSGAYTNGTITGYKWISDNDGVLSTKANFTTINLSSGTHTISFLVQGHDGTWSSEMQKTLVINKPPLADAGGPYFGWVSRSILFDGSNSTDKDGGIVSWKWELGDGNQRYGQRINHSYSQEGVYYISLTVYDDQGGKNTVTTSATIVGVTPLANAGGPYHGYRNIPLQFNGTLSNASTDTLLQYHWTFGDGHNATGVSPIHVYTNPGVYLVTLTIIDDEGQSGKNTTVAIIAEYDTPRKPTINGPLFGKTHEELTFKLHSTYSNGESIFYKICWGDGSTHTTPFFPDRTQVILTNLWSNAGNYTITVYTVSTADAASEPTTFTITINESCLSSTQQNSGFLLPIQTSDLLNYLVHTSLMYYIGTLLVSGVFFCTICILIRKRYWKKKSSSIKNTMSMKG